MSKQAAIAIWVMWFCFFSFLAITEFAAHRSAHRVDALQNQVDQLINSMPAPSGQVLIPYFEPDPNFEPAPSGVFEEPHPAIKFISRKQWVQGCPWCCCKVIHAADEPDKNVLSACLKTQGKRCRKMCMDSQSKAK